MVSVLLIEDDRDVRRLATNAMHTAGIQVSECQSAHESKDLIASGQFDLILLDLSLPDAHGFDLIDELQIKNPIALSRIALFTAAALDDEIQTYLPRLAGLIEKPFDHRELAAQVLDIINKSA